MAVRESIPLAAIPLAIFVLIYSFVNALASGLVFLMQWRYSEKLSLISIAAIIITISIILSMIQQVHYMIIWKSIRDAAYENAINHFPELAYAFMSTYNDLDTIVFLIRYYCYNVQSLIFLFWAIGLWRATWTGRGDLLRLKDENIVLFAKIFALGFPILIVSTMHTEINMTSITLKLMWANIVLIISTSVGCVFLILILCTYLHVRRKVACTKKPRSLTQLDVSFRVRRTATDESEMPTKPAPPTNMRSMSYDRWLIARFLVFFALSNVLQVCVIVWLMDSYNRYRKVGEQGRPDYSLHYVLDDLAIAMPGVSSGLMIFIVFGTTAPFRREYKKWLQPCNRKRQQRCGPIMVAPLDSIQTSTANRTISGRRRSFDEEKDLAEKAGRSSSESSTREIPPMEFGEFSETNVFPRSSTHSDTK